MLFALSIVGVVCDVSTPNVTVYTGSKQLSFKGGVPQLDLATRLHPHTTDAPLGIALRSSLLLTP